ncbi:MAG: ZIP family zinc transporter [Halobacteriales archaeon]
MIETNNTGLTKYLPETVQTETVQSRSTSRERLALGISVLGLVALIAVVALGLAAGRTKLVGIVVFGFFAMMAGVLVSLLGEFATPGRQVWAYGLASGAMLTSAAALIAPKAIGHHPDYGGFAIAFGYLIGYGAHELGHLVTHYELPINAAAGELTLHALAAGSIMGVAYGALPSLTPLFGYGIVAHKFPAGFTGSEAVENSGLPVAIMVVPAAAVAIAAIPLSILTPDLSPIVKAVFFGVSAGVFAHVGIDMLPECSHVGSHSDSTGHGAVHCSPDADRLRQYAVLSTLLGAAAIYVLWQVLAMG